jgi:undecaprenyl phosphate-alpha-L-ara4N flippase subunit ArnF
VNLRRGVTFAMGSVLLVSGAQLGMRWSMTRLPYPSQWMDAVVNGSIDLLAVGVVSAAILAYALSMLCWLIALRDLPLGRAYSLLSISYALVYLLAASLPAFHEQFSVSKSLGVTLVILGVITINSQRSSSSHSSLPNSSVTKSRNSA